MVATVPDILARIVGSKRAALELVTASDRASLASRAASRTPSRDFRAALTASAPAIIAEIKKASPSKGVLAPNFDPPTIARTYAAGGAAALSVLTDTDYFQGSLADLEAARAAVSIPVLRKDFTVTEHHVIEAAAHGADAILLIAAILDQAELRRLRELAAQYQMAALVEVHNAEELDSALASGAEIIGVNNRNLHTFQVTLETSLRLAEKIPASIVKVAESGIDSRAAIQSLQAAGFQAFLVGEHLMRAPDPAAALKELRTPKNSSPATATRSTSSHSTPSTAITTSTPSPSTTPATATPANPSRSTTPSTPSPSTTTSTPSPSNAPPPSRDRKGAV